jgi:hypothetical protein
MENTKVFVSCQPFQQVSKYQGPLPLVVAWFLTLGISLLCRGEIDSYPQWLNDP